MSIEEIIDYAIEEDLREGDHTTLACIPKEATNSAFLLVKEDGIIAGVEVAKKVFYKIDPKLEVEVKIQDGSVIKKGDEVLRVSGSSRSILSAERLALNILQRMSGIATHTNELVQLLHGLPTKLLDTRKTTPNFRVLEKMAVKIGGGENHRFGLFDMMMIKDNHIDYAGGITEAIKSCKEYLKQRDMDLQIEVEARNIEEVKEILKCGVDRIMLDNFDYETLEKAVQLIGNSAETEASGGITKATIRRYAETGVDYISVGALTHQISSLDLSLKAV